MSFLLRERPEEGAAVDADPDAADTNERVRNLKSMRATKASKLFDKKDSKAFAKLYPGLPCLKKCALLKDIRLSGRKFTNQLYLNKTRRQMYPVNEAALGNMKNRTKRSVRRL